MPLKIAVINLTGGGASGGYRKYLENVLPILARHQDVDAMLCASPAALGVSGWFEPLDNVVFAECDPFRVLGAGNRSLHGLLDDFGPDVLFVPLERHFRHGGVPCVCMVRNMEPLAAGRSASVREAVRLRVQKVMARRAVEKATRVIAVSQYVAEYLHVQWGMSPDKIGRVYHGVTVPPVGEEATPTMVPSAWTGRFVLAAGSIQPYRGLGDLLTSLGRMRQDGHDVKVVVAGAPPPPCRSYYHGLRRRAHDLGLDESICWAGNLDEGELAWCYSNARAFLMTSRVEACPNIALEALSHGCLIVSTDSPPMPEIFGEVASYYRAGDSDALSARLAEAVSEGTASVDRQRKAAVERATSFSWARTVDDTVRELTRAVGGRGD